MAPQIPVAMVPLETPYDETMGARIWLFDQTARKWDRWFGPTGLATPFSFPHKTTIAKVSTRPFGPCHLPLSAHFHENTTEMSMRLDHEFLKWGLMRDLGDGVQVQSPGRGSAPESENNWNYN